jgi:MtN3 and saliva related transmembrane protein
MTSSIAGEMPLELDAATCAATLASRRMASFALRRCGPTGARDRFVITVIEIAAATLTVAAFVPQAVKIIKTRNTKDLSALMWILQVIAFGLWIGYGIATRNWPIVVPNAISFATSSLILGLKLAPDPR